MYEYLIKAYVPPKPPMEPIDPEDPESPLYQPPWDRPYTKVYAHQDLVELEDGDTIIAVLNHIDPTRPEDTLIGGWDKEGNPVTPINMELYLLLRPLGNYPAEDITDEEGNIIGQLEANRATKHLKYTHWAGWKQRKLGTNRLYPDDNQPFPIVFFHKYFDGHDNPAHDGWGWRCEIDPDFVFTNRNPTDYFVNIYTDPRCRVEDNWYNSGGFTQQESEWFGTEENRPTVWADEYDQAYLGQGDKSDIYHGICRGSIHNQEGHGTLTVDEVADWYNFWENIQEGGSPPGGALTPSGITVTSIIGGGVFGVSSSEGFIDGETLTINNEETTFVRVHSPGIIVVDPHLAGAVGHEIYWVR